MRALFAQPSFVEYQDSISVLDRAQAVGDDQSSASGQQTIERFAN